MEGQKICPRCGNPVPPGNRACPWCAPRAEPRATRQETALLVSFLGMVFCFALTGYAAKLFHAKQAHLAQQWYHRGEAALRTGHARQAVEDFRSALAYSRDNSFYRLRLAQSLLSGGKFEEARTQLLNLWQQEPGSGIVNLELARLSARKQDLEAAVRYFHNAIFGVWENNPEARRLQVRLELCQFLLARGAQDEAQAALIELASDLPKDAPLHVSVGELFLQAGSSQRALEEFQKALQMAPQLAPALKGAGEAAFRMGDYPQARRYLEQATRADPEDTRVAARLETTRLVLNLDPFARRLSAAERSRRARQAFRQALTRLRACAEKRNLQVGFTPVSTQLQRLLERARELEPRVQGRRLERNSEAFLSAMELAFEIEEAAARECGYPSGADLALLLIARKHGGSEE